MKKRQILIISIIMVFTMLISTVSVFAASDGWPGFNGLEKDGGTINGKNSFTMHYFCNTKGTYKADLYKVNSKGSKVAYIRTVSFKCNTKTSIGGKTYYKGTASFSKASKNTYYCLYPKTKGHRRSFYGKTKK